MFDIEGIVESKGLENIKPSLSESELNYVEEVFPLHDNSLIIDRIDELDGHIPPKAIDSNKEISDLIEPIKDSIPSIYLEAPSDNVQIEEAAEMMKGMENLNYDEWTNLTLEEKVETLQKVENSIAEISHRPACNINVENLGKGTFGYFDPLTKEITINANYIDSNNFHDYKECLDTVIHEGRHAYQDYNVTQREVHPRSGEVTNWIKNEHEWGYQSAELFGFEAYEMQPVESDARAFAEDVLNNFFKA